MSLMILEQKLGYKGKTIKVDDKISITVVNENVNRILKRLEIDIYIDHIFSGTPSRAMLRSIIAKIYNVSEDVVVIKNIVSEYGAGASEAHIHIYASSDCVDNIEHKYILKRNNLAT